MKILFLSALIGLAPLVSAAEKDWVELYNGRDLSGWQTSGNWLPQKDGTLLIQPRPGEKGWHRYGSSLWSKKKYKDIVISTWWKQRDILSCW